MHTLKLFEGPGAPQTFVLEHRVTVAGRAATNDIVLDGPKVSKRHVLFSIRDDDRVQFEDLNSRNGVLLGESRVAEGTLESGAVLQIGGCRFLYEQVQSRASDSLPDHLRIETGYRLLVTDGDGYTDTIPLLSDCIYIGKSESNDLVLPSTDVSRRHAMLSLHKGVWELHDLESTNGTYLAGIAIDQSVLEPKQRFRIGRYLLALEAPGKPLARDEFEAEATREFKRLSGHLPWSTQIKLLVFLLVISALFVLLTALKLFGKL